MFPNGQFDDQVDSTSQALEWPIAPWVKSLTFLELARQTLREHQVVRGEPIRKVEWAKGSVGWQREQELPAEVEAELAATAIVA
jgi:hypothetical protein